MVDRDNEIVAKVLAMDPTERVIFMSRLKPDSLDYLDNLLRKAGDNTDKFKRFLKRRG